jgi:SAM-dependent methyltransferase
MSFDSLMRLSSAVQTLAAVGAELRLREEETSGDPRVRALLRDVLTAFDPQLLDAMDGTQQATALALVQTTFRQALELLEHPARKPGWADTDAVILQSQGQLSRMIVRGIEAIAAQRPELSEMMQRPGLFLDVGTGVGWIAIEARRAWPRLRFIGIDPWEPALALARENLAKSGVEERIDLRLQRVEDLDDAGSFTLAWLPGPFIAAEIADHALERIHRALVPGGWLIFGLHGKAPGPAEEALARLRIARSGGYPWTQEEVEARLRALIFFEQIEAFSGALSVNIIAARRKAS